MFKINHKNVYIFIIFFFIFFYSCADMMTYSLKLNEEKKYILTCNENQIEFQAKMNMGMLRRILIKPKYGKFDFYPDSLHIITNLPEQDVDIYMRFKYDKQKISSYQKIEKGKTLTCYLSIYGNYGGPIVEKILIPPSNFIMCDGMPLLTDTIRISLR